jgi:DNA invertase Pin-like site-specific DNA recombinase
MHKNSEKANRKKLGGRLERKPKEEPTNVYDWASFAFEKLVFIYERFSTREQKLKNAYSRERQDRLKQQALQQGATCALTAEDVERIKSASDYPGWYQDGQVVIEERDLVGVSGTKGQEERPGFAHMIHLIERGLVSAIYVVDVTRLFRDQYLINATQFVKLCSEKGVVVITESMVFDLRNDMHREIFMMQAQYASRELKMILSRLGGSRKAKAEMGKYAGDAVPVGFLVLPDEKGDRFNEFAVYEPHAKIIRLVFAKMLELRRLQAVARWCNQQGLFFPNFEPQYAYMTTRSAMRGMRPMPGPGGEIVGARILRSTLGHIFSNPAYKGQFMREGKIVKDDLALAIVDPETFDAVQAILAQNAPASRSGSTSQLLAGLLYCIAHEATQYLIYCSGRTYQCAYEQGTGLTLKRCFTAASDIFDTPVSQALLRILSYADRADKIISQLEQELSERQNRAQSLRREQARVKSERDSLFESLAYIQQEEPNEQRRKRRIKEINQKINEREEKLEELAKEELAPFENVLTTTEVTMVREFLTDLGTRWDEIPNHMRNAFLRVILERILVKEVNDYFHLEIHWRTGFTQKIIVYRPAVSLPKTR